MLRYRRIINISLLVIVLILGGVVAHKKFATPPPVHNENDEPPLAEMAEDSVSGDSIAKPLIADMRVDSLPMKATREDALPAGMQEKPASGATDLALSTSFREADVRKMVGKHPFAREAAKVVSGKLPVEDSLSRRQILNYCEHFRMAYNTKDVDFLRQVFSESALVIVGHTVKTGKKNAPAESDNEKVRFSVRTKHEYLSRLEKVFASNDSILVHFSDFKIMRHPTSPEIYGVTLRQKYSSDHYSDDGWLFLLWDFSEKSMPRIHVRTWQPGNSIDAPDDVINISDFNLE